MTETLTRAAALPFVFNDGGRAAAGYKGDARDCAARAIAIAGQMDYQDVYEAINDIAKTERPRGGTKRSSARTGVHAATLRKLLARWGWTWTPTMHVGSGTTVHLAAGELPPGRLIVQVSKHFVAVVDGVVQDDHDPTRDGTRAVYGYWSKEA